MPVDHQELNADRNQEWRNELRGRISAKERSNLPRVKMPELDAMERIRNFHGGQLSASTRRRPSGGAALPGCTKPALHRGLPGEHRHPRLHQADREGRFQRRGPEDKETNALPAVCGRVCPQESQCEAQCVLRQERASRWPSAAWSASSPTASGAGAGRSRPVPAADAARRWPSSAPARPA